jgi:hypothetical protein
MHRKWVVNASPLIVLGRINHLFLLQHLAEEIVVPAGVAKEIARGPEDDPARQWLQGQGRELVRETQIVPPVIILESWSGRKRGPVLGLSEPWLRSSP